MLNVGLTGGLASGKSFVGRTLADLGCFLVQADKLGHEVIEPGGPAYNAVLQEFQPDVPGLVRADGSIDRRALGTYVFARPERLNALSGLIHPAVRARSRELRAAYAREHPDGIAVTEAAILIETGSYRDYDRLIVAVCPQEQQIERAMERDKLTREEVLNRMRRQIPLEEKMKYADYVIDTSGPKEQTAARTKAVYEALKTDQRSLNK